MGLLIRKAFRYLYDRGEAWTYLMPAAEAIYEPFGFCPVSYAKPFEDIFCRKGHGGQEPVGRVYPYSSCPSGKKRELAVFAERCLSQQFSIYAVHDGRYFQEISEELQACGGDLLILEHGGDIIGYTELMYDEEEQLAEMEETVLADGKQEQAYSMLRGYLPGICGQERLRTVFTESGFLPQSLGETGHSGGPTSGERCQIMARILVFEKAARWFRRPEGWPERICCRVTDGFLEENNGVWELCFDGGGTEVRRTQEEPSVSMDICEFTSLFFAQHPVYINDMV